MLKKIKLFMFCCVVGASSMQAMEAPNNEQKPIQRMKDALRADNVDIVKGLLDNEEVGLETYLDNEFKLTPFLASAIVGAAKSGTFLLERGANRQAVNCGEIDALQLAAFNNRPGFLGMLLDQGFTLDNYPDKNPLELSVRTDAVLATDFLLGRGAIRGPFPMYENEGSKSPTYVFPLLHFAVVFGAHRVTELLLKKYQCNPNALMRYGCFAVTPNDLAVMNSHWSVAQLLEEAGADATSHRKYMRLNIINTTQDLTQAKQDDLQTEQATREALK